MSATRPATHRISRALWLAGVLALPAAADENVLSAPAAVVEQILPAIVDSTVKTVDSTHEYVSQRFVGFVTDIDHFFGSERTFHESNESALQLDINELMQPGGNREAQMQVKAKLRLPATEQRLHILLESDPERNTGGTETSTRNRPLNQLTTPANYGVAVGHKREKEGVWHYSSDLGVKVRLPLEPFARSRVDYVKVLDSWRMRTTQSLFWFSQSGAGETTQLDFERALGDSAMFRATSAATWMHMLQRFDLSQNFSVYHTLDEKRALLYEATVVGVSHPQGQVDDYIVSLRYRQQLNRRWLSLEFNPQLHFPRDNGYRGTPLLLLRLEALFGGH